VATRATFLDMKIDTSELKNSLSECVLQKTRAALHPGLAALARRGSLTLGAPNAPELYESLSPLLPPGSATRLLDSEREEPGLGFSVLPT